MADALSPIVLVVGGDSKRLQWMMHHITSHWSDSVIATLPATQSASLGGFINDPPPDIVLLHVDFSAESQVVNAFDAMLQALRLRPGLHFAIVATHGSELTAARAFKAGARDYLPLELITREMLLGAIAEPTARRAAVSSAVASAADSSAAGAQSVDIELPGYEVLKTIATSNFSSVYLARAQKLQRNVVVKTMERGKSVRELQDEERFQREYEIISSIVHPSIVGIHDYGVLPKHLYLAMEYFPCGDLRDRLRNPLSVAESLYYLRSIAEALRVIHVFGILHRDLKPANVMLREDNSPVLIDFGLARRTDEESSTTGVGKVMGSPYYMSPEQAQGHRVDARSDLYSLGVMFHEMLTGRRPYLGRSALAIMAQHTKAPVPTLPEELAAQQALLDRLMSKETRTRYATADELLADLAHEVAHVA